ncbi:MAG TPA: capsule assembly Wzi family protein [Firmicutes bacterium]|nr:capsule assembly Wzi family protein [Bacillota bacterium]
MIAGRWLLAAVILAAFLPGGMVQASGEFSLQAASPDVVVDSLSQRAEFSTWLNRDWKLTLSYRQRSARDQSYNGIDQAFVATERRLPWADASIGVTLGRAATNWSPWGGDSVVLSGDAPGVDQLQVAYRQGGVGFEKLLGKLSGSDRYLLAHRVSLRRGGFFAAAGEAAVVDGAFLHNLVTLLPFPVYLTQWVGLQSGTVQNDEVNDNAFVQVAYQTPSGFLVGGEFFADDAPGGTADRQPFQVAGLLRVETPLPAGGRITTQYGRANNFTYSFQAPSGHYTNEGYCLGYPYGPDSETLSLGYQPPANRWGIREAGLTVRRQGEGKIGDVWESEGYEGKAFLSGTVETTRLVYVEAGRSLNSGLELTVRLGLGTVENYDHRAGDSTVRVENAVGLRYCWD